MRWEGCDGTLGCSGRQVHLVTGIHAGLGMIIDAKSFHNVEFHFNKDSGLHRLIPTENVVPFLFLAVFFTKSLTIFVSYV